MPRATSDSPLIDCIPGASESGTSGPGCLRKPTRFELVKFSIGVPNTRCISVRVPLTVIVSRFAEPSTNVETLARQPILGLAAYLDWAGLESVGKLCLSQEMRYCVDADLELPKGMSQIRTDRSCSKLSSA